MVESNNRLDDAIDFSPIQEHFLKKYLIETRLKYELQLLSKPKSCELLGYPFKTTKEDDYTSMTLLKFFFKNFVVTFPFLKYNSIENQITFWQKTVQPFVDSFNLKTISDSQERKENVTKRRQVNHKLLSGLLLFFNSVLITEKDLEYLNSDHLKITDGGRLEKLEKKKVSSTSLNVGLDEYEKMTFENDTYLNIVAVQHIVHENKPIKNTWGIFGNILSYHDSPTHKSKYKFIVQVVTRRETVNGYDYNSHFIARSYTEFKRLESGLKRKFPGLMSGEITKLPSKYKNDEGFSEDREIADSFTSGKSSFQDNKSLRREKLRLGLRGYLNLLIKFPEILHSDIFSSFLSEKQFNFQSLSPTDNADYLIRLDHEKLMVQTQLEFQTETSKVAIKLANDFDKFKQSIVRDPDTLTNLFRDIGLTSDINKLSPLLKTFNEWCKLEISATLYQVFFTQDNSNEFLNKCQKFHKLFPYNIVYGILRFTNPVKIVSRVVDLLLVNIPTFSLPSWGGSKHTELEKEAKNSGSKNLLSMIFVMLLNEDLNEYEKELDTLYNEKLKGEDRMIMEKVKEYCSALYAVVENIKETSMLTGKDLLLSIITSDILDTRIEESSLTKLEKSYDAYRAIDGNGNLEEAELYINLKQYWRILLRKNDKQLFKQLWQEPELTMLVKDFLTLFYQPLMSLFSKCDIHLIFKDFQRFMNELIHELVTLNNSEIYYLTSDQIFHRIKNILDNHDKSIWNFIHKIYTKDDQELFLNLIRWVQKFIDLLRLKYVDPDKVKIHLAGKVGINNDLLMKQLSHMINNTLKKRMLFKQYLLEKSYASEEPVQNQIDKRWTELNENAFGNFLTKDFGLNEDDLDDYNMLNSDSTLNLLNELKKKLHDIDTSNDKYGTSEMDKFMDPFEEDLIHLLKILKV